MTGISNHRFDRRKDCFWRSWKHKIGAFDERRSIPLTEYTRRQTTPDGTVEIRKIAINRDLGTKLEISPGSLSQTDQIITGPPPGLVDGSVANAVSSNEAEIERSTGPSLSEAQICREREPTFLRRFQTWLKKPRGPGVHEKSAVNLRDF